MFDKLPAQSYGMQLNFPLRETLECSPRHMKNISECSIFVHVPIISNLDMKDEEKFLYNPELFFLQERIVAILNFMIEKNTTLASVKENQRDCA